MEDVVRAPEDIADESFIRNGQLNVRLLGGNWRRKNNSSGTFASIGERVQPGVTLSVAACRSSSVKLSSDPTSLFISSEPWVNAKRLIDVRESKITMGNVWRLRLCFVLLLGYRSGKRRITSFTGAITMTRRLLKSSLVISRRKKNGAAVASVVRHDTSQVHRRRTRGRRTAHRGKREVGRGGN